MRYLIKFSYDGTDFCGYQRQPGERCVEYYIIKAVQSINNGKETKGLYLHGNFGAGKTYLIAALFNELAIVYTSIEHPNINHGLL